MNILIADKFEASGIEALRALAEVHYEAAAGAEGLARALARVRPDLLIVRSSNVSREAMGAAPGLRAIIRAGAGVDNIDLAAATELGIAVGNCPGTNAAAVAELTLGLLIACDRRIPDQTGAARAGAWNKKEFARARGLKGATLGVVGLGAIGRAVILRARALEMNILVWSRSVTPSQAQSLSALCAGNDRASLFRMLPQCDAITVHVALAPDTKRLCNAEFFGAMKPGAIFVNTSRGGVVDEAALLEAAKTRGLRVGLDVYDDQPPSAEGPWKTPFADLRGAALTHHCGASTDQAQRAVADEVVRMVRVLAQTGRLENCVNEPAAKARPAAAQPV
ncbi:MAG: NAD(P)-dependent oxidoreductase [Phycisphaerales bacterium]